jgi:phosphate transport system protein
LLRKDFAVTEHTLRAYDRQLASLTETILAMGKEVDDILQLAIEGLHKSDAALLEQARATDRDINAKEREIEKQVNVLLALQNPVAIDLRYITSASKIAASLERMGDLAKNTVRQCIDLSAPKDNALLTRFDAMMSTARAMLKDALSAYTHLDAPKATQVWQQDDLVDDTCNAIFISLREEMLNNPKAVDQHLALLFASKNIERMADYAAKIAKIVHFVTSGKPATKAMLKAEVSALSQAAQA